MPSDQLTPALIGIRLAALPAELWNTYELAINETILTELDQLEDFAYPWV